jgi:hypothetical protein
MTTEFSTMYNCPDVPIVTLKANFLLLDCLFMCRCIELRVNFIARDLHEKVVGEYSRPRIVHVDQVPCNFPSKTLQGSMLVFGFWIQHQR